MASSFTYSLRQACFSTQERYRTAFINQMGSFVGKFRGGGTLFKKYVRTVQYSAATAALEVQFKAEEVQRNKKWGSFVIFLSGSLLHAVIKYQKNWRPIQQQRRNFKEKERREIDEFVPCLLGLEETDFSNWISVVPPYLVGQTDCMKKNKNKREERNLSSPPPIAILSLSSNSLTACFALLAASLLFYRLTRSFLSLKTLDGLIFQQRDFVCQQFIRFFFCFFFFLSLSRPFAGKLAKSAHSAKLVLTYVRQRKRENKL